MWLEIQNIRISSRTWSSILKRSSKFSLFSDSKTEGKSENDKVFGVAYRDAVKC